MLKKKYYDGFTVHDILSKHLDDGYKILELLTAFADADGVDAVPKWIPCSERLPQTTWQFSDCESFKLIDNEVVPVGVYSCYESDPVLVCGSYDGKSGIFTAIYDEWKHEDGAVETGWRDNAESEAEYMVIAWMPLPKPYDAEREE